MTPHLQGPRRPRVLVIAYACEPAIGSEPAAGWGLVRALASMADCTVLVASEHMPGIASWESQSHDADASVRFVEVGERWIAGPRKRHRFTRFCLYVAWMRRALAVGRQLHGAHPFDLVWHATYSTYWLPSPAIRVGIPCVWGPVGGAVVTPRRMWPLLGLQGLATELLDWAGVRLLAATPWTRHTWRNASVRLLQNEDTLARLPASMRPDAVVLNHAMFTEALPSLPRRPQPRTCVAVSALESRKGVALALHALTHARDVTLEVVGDGPERRRLERLAVRLGVADRVVFHGRVPRERLPEYFARAAALVSTGVREEGGMALTEALLSGAPVIVVAHGGARTIAQRADPRRVHLVQPDTLGAMAADMGAAMMRFTNGPIEGDGPALDREASLGVLRGALERALRTRTSGAVAEAPAAAAPLAATH